MLNHQVLFGFSLLLDNSVMIDLMGIAVGHIYFYLEDVFPNINVSLYICTCIKITVYCTVYTIYLACHATCCSNTLLVLVHAPNRVTVKT